MTKAQQTANKKLRANVRAWCKAWSLGDDYRDECGDLNCTRLAEDAAEQFSLYESDPNYTIPEWVFEITASLETDR